VHGRSKNSADFVFGGDGAEGTAGGWQPPSCSTEGTVRLNPPFDVGKRLSRQRRCSSFKLFGFCRHLRKRLFGLRPARSVDLRTLPSAHLQRPFNNRAMTAKNSKQKANRTSRVPVAHLVPQRLLAWICFLHASSRPVALSETFLASAIRRL